MEAHCASGEGVNLALLERRHNALGFPRRCRQKPADVFAPAQTADRHCPALIALSGGPCFAQMESGERGILPIDSSGTLEITGIHVDVGGKDAQSARFAGWRIAQREGFKALWAKMHKRPLSRSAEPVAIRCSTGWSARSSSSASRSAPTATSPTSAYCSTGRARANCSALPAQVRRSAPMLLIPVMVTGGTATSVELRNPWQRAWAQFRTSQSAIDYVRVSGLGIDPLLVNAAQTRRPGRGWWRNIVDLYGAADILVAEVQVHRLYPGGPAIATFIGRQGPDGRMLGGFELTGAGQRRRAAR